MMKSMNKVLLTLGALLVASSGSVYRASAREMVEVGGLKFEDMQRTRVGVITASGDFLKPVVTKEEEDFTKRYADQVRRINDPTYAEKAFDLSKATVVGAAKVSYAATTYALDNAVRYSAAYLTSYYFEEAAVAGIAKGAGGITTLMAGPAAGLVVEQGINTLYKVTKFVPGLDGVAAIALTPTIKAFVTDPLITYGPSLTKQAAVNGYNAATAVANKSYNALASAYSWWSGKNSK